MRTYIGPAEDGWPYPDADAERADPAAELDDDLLTLRIPAPHLLDDLDPLEREVIAARFGLNGHRMRSVHQLCADTGSTPQDINAALGSGLAKLRMQLT